MALCSDDKEKALLNDFRGELCKEKGENKNSRAVNRPKIEVTL